MPQTLHDSLKKVLDLQGKWSTRHTADARTREVIRNGIPAPLKRLAEEEALELEGRDGTGRKTWVP
jgi:hypothetical protein